MEAGAVFHARGNRDVHLMVQQLDAAARARRARLRPRLAAAAASAAGAAHGHVERNGRALERLARRDLERRRQRARLLFDDEGAADMFDGGWDRWKIDDDLVGKPPPIVARVIRAAYRDRMSAEAAEPVPGHRLLLR